jgi:hypothetical protein
MTVHRIVITPSRNDGGNPRHSIRGALYDVTYQGEVIVIASTEPCYASARILKARGLSGRLEMWDTVLPYCRFRADLDKAAGLTVREGDEPPRLVKFKSFAPRNSPEGNFESGGTQLAQTAETRPTDCPRTPTDKILAGQKV